MTTHPKPTPKHPDFRSPTGGSLLSHTETWAGDDFEECLETVYETRSPIKPCLATPHSQAVHCGPSD